ncbi:MAG: thermonuclease family protein [Nanoarchaeota archaeon]|nr:thermonuclease family protein [Nanoarchaeota archaeon]
MKAIWIVFLLIFIISGIFFYKITGNTIKQEVFVEKVIDGDTLELENGMSIRLLGINTPEKNMPHYSDAKEFLDELVLNKTVILEFNSENKNDKYGRTLAYIFIDKTFVNKEILERGFGNLYYYDSDKYTEELIKAEQWAKNNNLGIWKKSKNYGCLNLIKFEYKEKKGCTNSEQLIINNKCNQLNVIIKDDANHIYKEKINSGIFTKNFSCIFNNDKDSIIIRDDGGLIFYYSYSN